MKPARYQKNHSELLIGFVVIMPSGQQQQQQRRRRRPRVRPYHGQLEAQTLQNRYYRRVIHTNSQQQLVLMELSPGQEVGMESHPHTSQFVRVEYGEGVVVLGRQAYPMHDGFAVVIPPGTRHNLVAGPSGLRLYTLYSPPAHPKHCRQREKEE